MQVPVIICRANLPKFTLNIANYKGSCHSSHRSHLPSRLHAAQLAYMLCTLPSRLLTVEHAIEIVVHLNVFTAVAR